MKMRILQLAVALGVSMSSYAQTSVWNPAANETSTGNWNEAANWTAGIPNPGSGKAVWNVPEAVPTIITDAQEVFQMVQGDNADGGEIIVKAGGSLTTGDVWSGIGYNAPAVLTVETGGMITFGQHMWIGFLDGENSPMATVNINGGTVAVMQMIGLGWETGKATVNLRAGLFDLANINANEMKSIGEGSLIDITGSGLMTINGNRLAHTGEDGVDYEDQLAGFLEADRITALGGNADVQYWYNEEADETYITAPALIASTVPLDADTDVSRDSEIIINFSKKIDEASLGENITISPAIENQAFTWSATGDTLTISGDLEDGVTYAIEVAKETKDLYGFELAFDEAFSFTIEGELKNVLSSDLSQALRLYPNPTANYFTFGELARDIKIFNIGGQLLAEYDQAFKVDVSALSHGQYFVKATINEKLVTSKLLIQK